MRSEWTEKDQLAEAREIIRQAYYVIGAQGCDWGNIVGGVDVLYCEMGRWLQSVRVIEKAKEKQKADSEGQTTA